MAVEFLIAKYMKQKKNYVGILFIILVARMSDKKQTFHRFPKTQGDSTTPGLVGVWFYTVFNSLDCVREKFDLHEPVPML